MGGYGGSGSRGRVNTLNPNAMWIANPGFVIWYIGVFVITHLALLSLPFLSTPWAWTLTNLAHAGVTFYLFHWIKGSPVETIEDAAKLTQWEQMTSVDDDASPDGWSKKFLQLFPIIPFFLSIQYSHHNHLHFVLNLAGLLLSIIPKIPGVEGTRLFGLNRY
mmetsp:Transcript_11047/g.33017  ORF Transcript_11047/g.33017 Transcript_11047/m.33017 type:complete len:162 (+) Transcript_11047:120-605(+)